MQNFIGSSSLKFLSIMDFIKLCVLKKEINYIPQFSDHYFTGEYPIERIDQNDSKIVSQLSLLSNKSNN